MEIGLFVRDQFEKMTAVLIALKGSFILSLNAVRGVFETLAKFRIEEVNCRYSVSGQSKNVREVIISTVRI